MEKSAVVAERSRALLHSTGGLWFKCAGYHGFVKPGPIDLKPGPIDFMDLPHLEEMEYTNQE